MLGGFFGYRYITQAKQIESIAVMPFLNDSGNSNIEYLSDGMTESLINSLSQIPNLSVKARSSVFRYKGKEPDLKTVAAELNVQAVLTGHITNRGELMTLSLELIDARTENTIWGERYERKEFYLPQLLAAAEAMRAGFTRLEPLLTEAGAAATEAAAGSAAAGAPLAASAGAAGSANLPPAALTM